MRHLELIIFFVFVIISACYILSKRSVIEPYQEFDIQQFIKQIQQASGQLGKEKAYDDWIGWLYTHVETSGKPLDDFKKRVFQPSCKFRRTWATELPPGMVRPFPAKTKELANIAYRTFLTCLAEGNQHCLNQLEDARQRFMEPNCNFLNPRDTSSYAKDVQEVFV